MIRGHVAVVVGGDHLFMAALGEEFKPWSRAIAAAPLHHDDVGIKPVPRALDGVVDEVVIRVGIMMGVIHIRPDVNRLPSTLSVGDLVTASDVESEQIP